MKNTILVLNMFFTTLVFSQVGINTNNPQGIFHIDAKSDNNNILNTENVKNDIIVSNSVGTEAYIGIGNSSPKVRLDVRGDDTSVGSAIAVGSNNISAVDAGSGALRWNNNYLQYSNGNQWINIQSTTNTQKAIVIANKSNSTQISRRTSYFFGWNELYDNTGSFSQGQNSSGEIISGNLNTNGGNFTAPRDGVYLATFTFATQTTVSSNPVDNNQIEAIWDLRNQNNTVKNRFKCANNFPANTFNNQSTIVGSNCSASIYMLKGEKLYPFVWVDLTSTGTVPLLTDSSYNTLTIVEQ